VRPEAREFLIELMEGVETSGTALHEGIQCSGSPSLSTSTPWPPPRGTIDVATQSHAGPARLVVASVPRDATDDECREPKLVEEASCQGDSLLDSEDDPHR